MVLSNQEIKEEIENGWLTIDPLDEEQVQPASIDLRLGEDIQVYSPKRPSDVGVIIDSKDASDQLEKLSYKTSVSDEPLWPDRFYLGTTVETIDLPPDLYAEISGRSSIGRLGVVVHKTAGIVDPGYTGEITLEMECDMPYPVQLYPGQRIVQLTIHRLDEPADPHYGNKKDSKYQNQRGATESKIFEDKDAEKWQGR